MSMRLKFHNKPSLKEQVSSLFVKIAIFVVAIILVIFVLEKIPLPNPKNEIKEDITNEIKKLE